MRNLEELRQELVQIDIDLDRVETALTLYDKSTKDFGDEQGPFVELINARGIGAQHHFIQMILLHDCVAALCRITDHASNNRITIESAMGRANSIFGDTRRVELKPISKKIGLLKTSDEMRSLRAFRDKYIGHTLKGDPISAAYMAIPTVAAQVSEIVASLYGLCGGKTWKGEPSKALKAEQARRFWHFLERGMQDDQS